jgi:hypothetical protein
MPIRSVRSVAYLTFGALLCVSGCASPGPFESHRTTVGTLKASNAQLEHEKSNLSRQVAELEAENRRIEDRLTQEEEANGWLTARLNDARDLISRQGLDATPLQPDARTQARTPRRSRTAPTGATRKPRQAPFAEIPGELNAVPHPDRDTSDEAFDDFAPRTSQSDSEIPTSSRTARNQRWLPIANGISDSAPKVR